MKRLYTLTLVLILVTGCTAPIRNQHAVPVPQTTRPAKSSVSTPATVIENEHPRPPSYPTAIPIAEWVGKKFFILTKQPVVKGNGYNLYSCTNEGCDTLPPDHIWEHPHRKIRCESLENETLTVTNITPDSTEWIVTFLHEKSGKSVYGTTHKHALQECVFLNDLSGARKRWLNTFIFSKKGTILKQNASNPSSLSSFKVNILDSLQVTDIQFGTTPLPVKPLWLFVRVLSSGKKGFIPVRFSWTNTMIDRISTKAPWDNDIFELDPRTRYDWDDYTWEVINNHRVILEMTPEQVTLSWGNPDSISSNLTSPENKVYHFPSHTLYFTQGTLTKIETAK